MRTVVSLGLVTVLAVAGGCGGGAAVPGAVSDPLPSLSFGVDAPPAQIGIGSVPVRIFNYSHARILDAGYRPAGSAQAFEGSLLGLTPAHRDAVVTGQLEWTTLSTGAYEIFIATDLGELRGTGYIGTYELPDGTHVPQQADIYLFGRDFAAPGPIPGSGGGVIPGRSGQKKRLSCTSSG